MSLITRSANASIDANQARQILAGLLAGETIPEACPCYIKTSDGLLYMANGTAANEAAEVVGFSARAVVAGNPVTLFGPGSRFQYGSGLTPGNVLYLGATAGRLDSAPTVGDGVGVAQVISTTDIVILRGMPSPAAATFLAAANPVGVAPTIHRFDLAAGALADTDIVLTRKERVIDAYLVLQGAGVASTTLQVKNGATAITNAMAASGSDQALVRAASLDDAAWDIASGGTLRVTSAAGATQPAATVFVLTVPVA